MRIRFVLSFLVVVLSGLALFASACSNQGEGERCSRLAENNGKDDCQSDLVCINISTNEGDRCCPADPSRATTAVCKRSSSGSLDAAPPVTADSGTADAFVPDTGSDTGTADTGTDAGLDAADAADG